MTKFLYDERSQQTETILPDGTPGTDADNLRTRTQYDAAGQVIVEIDAAGRVTRFEYDGAGRQTKVILPDGTPATDADNPVTLTVYDLAGRVIAQFEERGNATRFEYDAAGNQTATIVPDDTPANLTDNPRFVDAYDNSGRRTSSTDPLGRTTTFEYTAGGLLAATLFADGTQATSGFDSQKRLTSRTDQNGITSSYEYDDLGRLTAVTQPLDGRNLRTEYTYDELGNLTIQRDALGRETRYEYDGLGRRTKILLPDNTPANLTDNFFSTTVFDAAGRVSSTTDFNGDTVRFEYEVLDRLEKKDFPIGTDVTYTYTPTGQRETETDARGVTRYEYDAQDRLKKRTDQDGASIEYEYDAAGNRVGVTTTVPGNDPRTTSYTFDVQSRLETVTDPEDGLTTYYYDAASQIVRAELPNGTYETREYNQVGRLLSVESFRPDNTILVGFHYELDDVGNRTRITEETPDGFRVVDYAYDDLYRLTGETMFEDVADLLNLSAETADRTITYDYDDVGNRLARSDSAEGPTTYTYDAMDRLLTETLTELAGEVVSTTYGYDRNGNTTSKSASRNGAAADRVFYDWDFENRLVAADTNGDGTNDVAYEYDADGLRVSKTEGSDVTRFLLDKNLPFAQVLEEYTPGGIIKVSYAYGNDLISQNREGAKSFYHVDSLGSTRALSNASGVVTDRYMYDAYGQTIGQTGSTGNVYLFAGEARDGATGLDYLRARWMDTGAGRFVSRDAYAAISSEPMSLHRYIYSGQNPVNYVDPTGNFSLGEAFAVNDIIGNLATISTPTYGAEQPLDIIVDPLAEMMLRCDIPSGFGQVRPSGSTHRGWDLLAETGTPVRSIAFGKIDEVRNSPTSGFGKEVILKFRHDGQDLWLQYAHLSHIIVGKRDSVVPGSIIGFTGTTGYRSPPNPQHLHMELHTRGGILPRGSANRIDPMRVLGPVPRCGP